MSVKDNTYRGKNRKVRIEQVYDRENMLLADKRARRGKSKNKGVVIFDANREILMADLIKDIANGNYHTSEGHECVRHCPCGKDRLLHKLPYYPDHIEHHALMQVLLRIMERYYYYDTFASVKGKGIHFCKRRVEQYIDRNKDKGRIYYVALDFVKFYHMIDQQHCYDVLCEVFGNKGIRYLLKEVVTACKEGLGIGLFPIQPIATLYLCKLCREVNEKFDVHVFLYCDDLKILGTNKKEVWKATRYVKEYADIVLKQPLHTNIGMQIIDEHHCLDFVGYQFFFNHTLVRKSVKNRFKQRMAHLKDPMKRYQVASSYRGWLMHCNGYNLWKSVMGMKSFADLKLPEFEETDANGKRILQGREVKTVSLLDRPITFLDCETDIENKYGKGRMLVQVEEHGQKQKFFTKNRIMIKTLSYIKENNMFPFMGTIRREFGTNGFANYFIE